MAPRSWVEVICHSSVWVSWGLNLNLSSVGGRSLALTDYYRAESRRYVPDRAKTEAETMRQSRSSKVEIIWGRGEAEPAKKNCLEAASSRGRCLEDYIPGNCKIVRLVNIVSIIWRKPVLIHAISDQHWWLWWIRWMKIMLNLGW